MSKNSNFCANLQWETLSKALDKSRIPISTCCLLFNTLAKLLQVVSSYDAHKCLFQKPNCASQTMLFLSK